MSERPTLERGLAALLAGALALAVVAVLWQVVSRYLLGDPSSFTDELVRYLLIWIGLLGGAHAAGRRLHLAIDLLPHRLPTRSRHRLAVVVHALVGLFAFAVLVVGGGNLVLVTARLGQTSAALGVPLAGVYLALPVAGLVMVATSLRFVAEAWHAASAANEVAD
ncbi:MAG: TRAP transporter small permease [Acidobacteriota bacterium]